MFVLVDCNGSCSVVMKFVVCSVYSRLNVYV